MRLDGVEDVLGGKTGCSDPSYVVERETGTIFLFCVFSKDAGIWNSQYGNDDEDRMVTSANLSVSHDSGLTCEHRSLTESATPERPRVRVFPGGPDMTKGGGTVMVPPPSCHAAVGRGLSAPRACPGWGCRS